MLSVVIFTSTHLGGWGVGRRPGGGGFPIPQVVLHVSEFRLLEAREND